MQTLPGEAGMKSGRRGPPLDLLLFGYRRTASSQEVVEASVGRKSALHRSRVCRFIDRIDAPIRGDGALKLKAAATGEHTSTISPHERHEAPTGRPTVPIGLTWRGQFITNWEPVRADGDDVPH